MTHEEMIEVLEERLVEVKKIKEFFAPPSKMPQDLTREEAALQYFIGVGERMLKKCSICNGKKEWFVKSANTMYPCQDCNETGYIIDSEKLLDYILTFLKEGE